MAEGRSRDNWAHTSAILALIANVNRDPKKHRALKPADFDPHAAPKSKRTRTKDLSILKAVFVDRP